METLEALLETLTAFWNTASRWVRWTIALIILSPIVVIAFAINGGTLPVSIAALLPILIIILILVVVNPLILIIMAIFTGGRVALRIIATIIGVELVIGIYFSIVPTWNDQGLIPLLILVLGAILFLAVGVGGKLAMTTIKILVLIAIVITAIFFLGGREEISLWWNKKITTPTSTTRTTALPSPGSAPTEYDPLINEASQKYGVPFDLIKATIKVESGFDPRAVSSANARGLMQLIPETAAKYGVRERFDPAQNIDGGSHYLADLLKRYDGNVELATAAYNWGEDRIDKLINGNTKISFASIADRVPNETRQHVPKVMALYRGGNISVPTVTGNVALAATPRVATITELIAKPNQWSENFSVPPGYCFQISPKGKIRIKFWDGREIDDEPGKRNWLGNDSRNSNFTITSRESGDVVVKIGITPN
jgi:hypothetical protein